jgi:hypothetical protein
MQVTQELLKELFTYCQDSGRLINRVNRGKAKSGDESGGLDNKGYRRVRVLGERYGAHRLIWLYVHGVWPKEHIDHINGDRADNRLENLREATFSENMRNRKVQTNNKSGFKGVSFSKKNCKWEAHIKVNRKITHLGLFKTPEAAHEAYCQAAKQLHKNFANLG